MIAHLRTYTINKGMMDLWLELFDSTLVPLMAEHGMTVESKWTNDSNSQFIWIRAYGDTPAELEAKEAAFYGSDWWTANVDMVRSHIAHREVVVLKSV